MDVPLMVSSSLPFFMSYLLQFLKGQMGRTLAENSLRVISGSKVVIDGIFKELAVNLAMHFFGQLSFVLGALLSTVSALTLTLTSKRPFLCGLVVFVLLTVLATWVLRWQTLGAEGPVQRAKLDKEMSWASYFNTTLMLLVTVWSRLPMA